MFGLPWGVPLGVLVGVVDGLPWCDVPSVSDSIVLLKMKMNALKNCIALHFMKSSKRNSWDRPALGTGPSKFLDKPALGTCPSKCLGQARSWDRPFKILGTGPLLGQALQNSWDKPALGTGPLLGHARGSVYRVVKENVF